MNHGNENVFEMCTSRFKWKKQEMQCANQQSKSGFENKNVSREKAYRVWVLCRIFFCKRCFRKDVCMHVYFLTHDGKK